MSIDTAVEATGVLAAWTVTLAAWIFGLAVAGVAMLCAYRMINALFSVISENFYAAYWRHINAEKARRHKAQHRRRKFKSSPFKWRSS